MARSSLVKLRYRGVRTLLEKDLCLLRSITFKTEQLAWFKQQKALMAKPVAFGRYQLDSTVCMPSINNPRTAADKEENTSDVMPVASSSNVLYEYPFILRSDYSRDNASRISAKRYTKTSEALFEDCGADHNFESTNKP